MLASTSAVTYKFGSMTATEEEMEAFRTSLKKTTEDKVYYHWSDYKSCLRWAALGYVSEGEMAYLSRPEADNVKARAGAGMYLAENTKSSKSYGNCLTEFTIPKGTYIYSSSSARTAFKKIPDKRAKVELGRIVHFIDRYDNVGWNVVHTHHLTTKVALGVEPTLKYMTERRVNEFYHELNSLSEEVRNAGAPHHTQELISASAGYLTSLYALMYYFDPISLVRAIHVNPDNPWSEFEPEYFEAFRKGHAEMVGNIFKNGDKPYYNLGYGGKFRSMDSNFKSANSWVANARDTVLPMIFEKLSGGGLKQKWRSNEIRAGGPEKGKNFFAVGYHVEVMNRNKYLTVVPEKMTTPGDYLAHYYYPDLEHKAQLGRLTAEDNPSFMKLLLSVVLKELHDTQLVATRNGDHVKDVPLTTPEKLTDNRYHYSPSSTTMFGAAKALIDLISVHPSANFNGRSTRTFVQLAALEAGYQMPVSFCGDFDLVEFPNRYQYFIDLSTQLYTLLQKMMIREFVKKTFVERQKADGKNSYFKLMNGWMDLFKSLEAFGVDPPAKKLTDKQFDMIRHRQWVPLFDSLGGVTWMKNRLLPAKDGSGRPL